MPQFSKNWSWYWLIIRLLSVMVIFLLPTFLATVLPLWRPPVVWYAPRLPWIGLTYFIALIAILLPAARLVSWLGSKKIYLAGSILLLAALLLIKEARHELLLTSLLAVIAGGGAGLVVAACLPLCASQKDTTWLGILPLLALWLGFLIGLWPTASRHWQWITEGVGSIVSILALVAWRLPEPGATQAEKPLNGVSSFFWFLGVIFLLFGLMAAPRYGWWRAHEVFRVNNSALTQVQGMAISVYTLGMGVCFLILCFIWERRANRLSHARLFLPFRAGWRFMASTILLFGLNFLIAGLLALIGLNWLSLHQLSPLASGKDIVLCLIFALATGLLVIRYYQHVRAGIILPLGFLLVLVACVIWQKDLVSPLFHHDRGLAWIAAGLGWGGVASLLINKLQHHPSGPSATSLGSKSTLLFLAMSLGVSLMATLMLVSLTASFDHGLQGVTRLPKPARVRVADLLAPNLVFGGPSVLELFLNPPIKRDVAAVKYRATVKADESALDALMLVALLGVIAALALPLERAT